MDLNDSTIAVTVFLGGILAVMLLTPWVCRWAYARAVLDVPGNIRKIHAVPVPRLGGIAIFAAFLVVYFATSFFFRAVVIELDGWEQILLVVTPMFALGLWDDFHPLGAKKKLAGQVLFATLAYWIGLRIENVTNPFDGSFHFVGLWGLPLTVLWIVAVTNLINIVDGLDGLAGGVVLFLMVVMGVLAGLRGSWPILCLSAGMIGALSGFLIFNFPPARIFLGDGGAYFLGSLTACMALVNSSKGEVFAAMLVPFFALGLPILDTALAILRRGLLGLPIFRGDRQHIHHRLLAMGFSRRRTVVILYLICALLCLLAAVFFIAGSRWWALLLGVLFTMAILSVRALGYVKSWDKIGLQLAGSWEKRRSVQMAILLGKVLVLEAEDCPDWEHFRGMVADKLEKLGFHGFNLKTKVRGIEQFDWKPSKPRPWVIESAEWIEQQRAIHLDHDTLGTMEFSAFNEEDLLDQFDRIADIAGESIEEAFIVCYQRFSER